MSRSIIISRYSEKVEWLNKYKEFKIIIYNKGDKIDITKTIGRVKGSDNTSSELLISTFKVSALKDKRLY